MAQERKKLTFEDLVSIYFRNLHKIILTNILITVPFAVVGGLLYFISTSFGDTISTVVTPLCIIICYPLNAGVVKVTKNLACGEEKISVFKTFTDAVLNNYKQFFVHGIVLYLFFTIGIFTFSFYINTALAIGGVMLVLLISVILIALWFMFMFFYVPLMTVTYDLSIKDIYKNSALMAIGEIKVNLVALFAILILTAICTTPIILSGGLVWLLVTITFVMMGGFFPASYTYISTYFVQRNMTLLLSGNGDKIHSTKNAEERLARLRKKNEDELDDLDIEKVKNSQEEYIFHNGKMMKRTVLLEILEKRESV